MDRCERGNEALLTSSFDDITGYSPRRRWSRLVTDEGLASLSPIEPHEPASRPLNGRAPQTDVSAPRVAVSVRESES